MRKLIYILVLATFMLQSCGKEEDIIEQPQTEKPDGKSDNGKGKSPEDKTKKPNKKDDTPKDPNKGDNTDDTIDNGGTPPPDTYDYHTYENKRADLNIFGGLAQGGRFNEGKSHQLNKGSVYFGSPNIGGTSSSLRAGDLYVRIRGNYNGNETFAIVHYAQNGTYNQDFNIVKPLYNQHKEQTKNDTDTFYVYNLFPSNFELEKSAVTPVAMIEVQGYITLDIAYKFNNYRNQAKTINTEVIYETRVTPPMSASETYQQEQLDLMLQERHKYLFEKSLLESNIAREVEKVKKEARGKCVEQSLNNKDCEKFVEEEVKNYLASDSVVNRRREAQQKLDMAESNIQTGYKNAKKSLENTYTFRNTTRKYELVFVKGKGFELKTL